MVVRQHLHHAYWRRGVGVDGIYHADATHIDHRVTAKFRVIDNQHNVARVLNNGAFGANFVVIELQQRAVAIDAAYPQNAEIKAELGDKIERRFAMIPPSRLRNSPPARIIRKSSFTISVLATLRLLVTMRKLL